eukprot:5477967-Prymnesium_polylepis.1
MDDAPSRHCPLTSVSHQDDVTCPGARHDATMSVCRIRRHVTSVSHPPDDDDDEEEELMRHVSPDRCVGV